MICVWGGRGRKGEKSEGGRVLVGRGRKGEGKERGREWGREGRRQGKGG